MKSAALFCFSFLKKCMNSWAFFSVVTMYLIATKDFINFQFQLWKIEVFFQNQQNQMFKAKSTKSIHFFNNMIPFAALFLFWLIVFSSFLILKFSKITELLHLWLPKKAFQFYKCLLQPLSFQQLPCMPDQKVLFCSWSYDFWFFMGMPMFVRFFMKLHVFPKKHVLLKKKCCTFFHRKIMQKSCPMFFPKNMR